MCGCAPWARPFSPLSKRWRPIPARARQCCAWRKRWRDACRSDAATAIDNYNREQNLLMLAAPMQKTTMQRSFRPGQLVVTGLLLIAVVGSSVMLIYTTHQSRILFNDWQQQQRREWALDENWERLLLEQGTLAGYERVSQSAESRLDMVMPDPAAIQVVTP